MKQQHHFDSVKVSREAVQTKVLIADLDRIVQILDSDIAAGEEQSGLSHPSPSEYPILASALVARRDNLRDTIAALKRALGDQSEACRNNL